MKFTTIAIMASLTSAEPLSYDYNMDDNVESTYLPKTKMHNVV